MSNVILPFLLSMMLGRTIDLTTYTIRGLNVFDDADYDETPAPALNTSYNVLQDDMVPYTYFGIPPDIALRMKSNFLSSSSGAMGLDGLLKDTSWKYNSAIVAATTLYRTVDRTLKKDAVPMPNWTDKLPKEMTHYTKTLFYGGWALVMFRFKCDISSDVKFVRKVLTKHLGPVGRFSNETLPKWDAALAEIEANQDIRGTVKVNTHIYSTMPFRGSIDSPQDLIKIIEKLPRRSGHIGQPLYMDLRPLNELNDKYPVVKENTEMLSELEDIDEMFDDVKVTKVAMMRWITETPTVFSDEEEETISTMLENINDCIRVFSNLGATVSLYKLTDKKIFLDAAKTYKDGLEKGIANYNLAFRRIKENIDAQCEKNFLHKIRGLLRVYDDEKQEKGTVKGGLKECKNLCLADNKCRSIGYAEHLVELDIDTGLYHRKLKQCWIYYRSTSTAPVQTPNGLSGDLGVYDRRCY